MIASRRQVTAVIVIMVAMAAVVAATDKNLLRGSSLDDSDSSTSSRELQFEIPIGETITFALELCSRVSGFDFIFCFFDRFFGLLFGRPMMMMM